MARDLSAAIALMVRDPSTSLDRLALGGDALLSVGRTAVLLPIRDADARELIEAAGIVRRLGGRRVVLWKDAVAALARLESEPEQQPRPVRRLKRGKL